MSADGQPPRPHPESPIDDRPRGSTMRGLARESGQPWTPADVGLA